MSVHYYISHAQVVPEYRCQREGIKYAQGICQRIVGGALDRAIGDLLVETVSPLALEVALAVQDELETRAQEVDRIRRQQVERARYEAELAQCATSALILITDWSPIHWKRSGTTNSARWLRLRKTTNANAMSRVVHSALNSVSKYGPGDGLPSALA